MASEKDSKNLGGRPPKLWRIPDKFENVIKALVKPVKKPEKPV